MRFGIDLTTRPHRSSESKFNRLNYYLYSLKDWIPRKPSWKDAVLVGSALGVSALPAIGCGKDYPPEITSYQVPVEINADSEFEVSAQARDDRRIKEVYIVFEDGTKLRTTMEKVNGEYKARLKLPSKGEYWFSIVAKDRRNQETVVKDKMLVYPALDSDEDKDGLTWRQERELGTDPDKPNPNLKYVIDKNLTAYIDRERIKLMDEDGKQDEKEKLVLDIAYEISRLNITDDAKRNNISFLLSQLKAVSVNTLKDYLELGIEDNVIGYLSFLAGLTNKEFVEYALNNKLCIQDKILTELEKQFLREPEKYKQQMFNYNLSEIQKVNSELANELKKLPDFAQIEIKDVEALEDVVALAPYKSVGGISFDSMFNEGIKDKRKYSTPIQALVWSLYDHDKEYIETKPWETEIKWVRKPSDILKFVKWVWIKSSESNNFASDRWKEFNEVVDRLNSPMFIATYMKTNFSYEKIPPPFVPPEIMFQRKAGACSNYARFALYCLMKNGYSDEFKIDENSTAAILAAYKGSTLETSLRLGLGGHITTLYVEGGLLYLIDMNKIKGPFKTIEEAATSTYRNWETYELRDLNTNITKKVERTK